MTNGRDKELSRANRRQVRALFRHAWNPIGIDDLPDDEYDSYADRAYVMLMDEQGTAQDIAAYLTDIAERYMGLTSSEDQRRNAIDVATTLTSWRADRFFKT
jgi:hypothetical protein